MAWTRSLFWESPQNPRCQSQTHQSTKLSTITSPAESILPSLHLQGVCCLTGLHGKYHCLIFAYKPGWSKLFQQKNWNCHHSMLSVWNDLIHGSCESVIVTTNSRCCSWSFLHPSLCLYHASESVVFVHGSFEVLVNRADHSGLSWQLSVQMHRLERDNSGER